MRVCRCEVPRNPQYYELLSKENENDCDLV
jgi:hypothetical protein